MISRVKLVTAGLAAITLLAPVSDARAESLSVLDALVAHGANDVAEQICLGNACTGRFTEARYVWNSGQPGQGGQIHAKIRVHNKHHQCVDRPWPLHGEWCWDLYDYWATINITASVGSCDITNVAAQSDSEVYAVPAFLFTLIANTGVFNQILQDRTRFPGC